MEPYLLSPDGVISVLIHRYIDGRNVPFLQGMAYLSVIFKLSQTRAAPACPQINEKSFPFQRILTRQVFEVTDGFPIQKHRLHLLIQPGLPFVP